MSRTIIDGEYAFDYLPTQRTALATIAAMRTPNICFCGGFGCGKSRFLCEAGFELGCAYKGIRCGFFRKNRASITDTTYNDFLTDTVPPEYIGYHGHNKSKLSVELRNHSYYQFFGIDKFIKKGSLKFDVIFVDEGIELNEDDYTMLGGRLRGNVIPTPMMVIGTNAGPPGHYLYNKFVKPKTPDPDFKYFCAPSQENVFNPKAYFDRLEKWKGTQYYDRFVLSQWTAFEGIIYSMFNPEEQVIEPFQIPREWKKYVSIDFGYAAPLAIGWFAHDPIRDIYYLYRQYYHTRELLRDAIPKCKQISTENDEYIFEIIGDHDAEGRAQVESDWMRVTPACKDVVSGIQSTIFQISKKPQNDLYGFYVFDDSWSKTPFRYGLLKKDPLLEEEKKPSNFQEEIPGYIWGRGDEPKKENDHACDMVRYAIHTLNKRRDTPYVNVGEGARVSRR